MTQARHKITQKVIKVCKICQNETCIFVHACKKNLYKSIVSPETQIRRDNQDLLIVFQPGRRLPHSYYHLHGGLRQIVPDAECSLPTITTSSLPRLDIKQEHCNLNNNPSITQLLDFVLIFVMRDCRYLMATNGHFTFSLVFS